jgi:N-methylhydantoinase B
VLEQADGSRSEIGKVDVLRMPPRATLRIETAGGGGYGNPFERDPALVLADVRDGLVSLEHGRQEYGVAIVGDQIDEAETKRLRAAERPQGARFEFGAHRLEYDERWPDALQTAVNRLTERLPPAPRGYVRGRLIEAAAQRRVRGENVDEQELGAVYRQVMDELQASLLEAL